MGLSDILKRRRQRESAIPPSVIETGALSAPETSAATPTVTSASAAEGGHGKVAVNSAVMTQMQQLQSLMAEHSVDLRSQPMEVRRAVVDDLNAGGVPAKLGHGLDVTDPGQIETVVTVLKKHGLLPANVTLTSE
jgi:hypothetical protein